MCWVTGTGEMYGSLLDWLTVWLLHTSPFSVYRLMLDHPPLNTVWKGKVMLAYWERTTLSYTDSLHDSLTMRLSTYTYWRSFKRKITQTFSQILLQKNTSKPIYLCNGRFLQQKYNRILILGTNLHSILISISDLKDLHCYTLIKK